MVLTFSKNQILASSIFSMVFLFSVSLIFALIFVINFLSASSGCNLLFFPHFPTVRAELIDRKHLPLLNRRFPPSTSYPSRPPLPRPRACDGSRHPRDPPASPETRHVCGHMCDGSRRSLRLHPLFEEGMGCFASVDGGDPHPCFPGRWSAQHWALCPMLSLSDKHVSKSIFTPLHPIPHDLCKNFLRYFLMLMKPLKIRRGVRGGGSIPTRPEAHARLPVVGAAHPHGRCPLPWLLGPSCP